MKHTLYALVAVFVLSSSSAFAQSAACQVRIPGEDIWAGPLDTDSSFGTITLSEVARTVADYPGTSSSTEIVRMDGEPWTTYRDGVKYIYVRDGEGMTWIPYVEGNLKVIGYYIKGGVWSGPYPAGSFGLVLQNKTEWRVGVISLYKDFTIPIRVWLTTRVC